MEKYKELIAEGVEHYSSILKRHDLYDEVIERLERKNKTEPIILIKQIFETQSNFSEYLFSDLNYSLDGFYEGFEYNIKRIIDLSLQDLNGSYQIVTEFYDRQSKTIKAALTFYSNGKSDEVDPALYADLINSAEMKWRIVIGEGIEQFEFLWVGFGEENLIRFLNFINGICEEKNSDLKWFPIASSYGSDFIFTKRKHYDLIVELCLMPPEGYQIDEVAVVHYPKGISALKDDFEEILPVSNISCEVPMEKKVKVIYVKLWRKSKQGNLDVGEVPMLVLGKLKSLSTVCNRMNWDYGNVVLDINKILSDNEFERIVVGFLGELKKAIQSKEVNLEGKVVSIFRNDEHTLIKSLKVE